MPDCWGEPMAVSIAEQGWGFLGSVLLGVCLGILYDLFRLFRVRLRLRWLGGFLDLSFWLVTVCALFIYAVEMGNGEVRVYLMVGIVAGGGGYFRLCSPLTRFLGDKCADGLGFLWKIFLLPLRGFVGLWKKFIKNQKNLFHYRKKWYRIKKSVGEIDSQPKKAEGGDSGATEKSELTDQAGGYFASHHRKRDLPSTAGADRLGARGAGRASASGGAANSAKRRPSRRGGA